MQYYKLGPLLVTENPEFRYSSLYNNKSKSKSCQRTWVFEHSRKTQIQVRVWSEPLLFANRIVSYWGILYQQMAIALMRLRNAHDNLNLRILYLPEDVHVYFSLASLYKVSEWQMTASVNSQFTWNLLLTDTFHLPIHVKFAADRRLSQAISRKFCLWQMIRYIKEVCRFVCSLTLSFSLLVSHELLC